MSTSGRAARIGNGDVQVKAIGSQRPNQRDDLELSLQDRRSWLVGQTQGCQAQTSHTGQDQPGLQLVLMGKGHQRLL